MIYCLKLFFLYAVYMQYIWSTNVQYCIDLILMEGPCSYTMDSRKNNTYFIVHGYMLDNIQACLYMGS